MLERAVSSCHPGTDAEIPGQTAQTRQQQGGESEEIRMISSPRTAKAHRRTPLETPVSWGFQKKKKRHECSCGMGSELERYSPPISHNYTILEEAEEREPQRLHVGFVFKDLL